MPSSLIIVGLAAAWLAVLVPMIARKRQEVTRPNDSVLAARVVRSGSTRSARRKELAMTGSIESDDDVRAEDEDLIEAGYDSVDDDLGHDLNDDYDERVDDLEPEPVHEPGRGENRRPRRYRPGRGGFDPEAAEMAARAKYAFRQRAVVMLLLVAAVTAVLAGLLWTTVWWAHGAVDLALVAYLVYLRRQVRIEEEIRQRRLARFRESALRAPQRPDPLDDIEVLKPEGPGVVGAERKPVPTSRVRRQAVVVDPDDEDPAFHELDEPGQLPYRRASGE